MLTNSVLVSLNKHYFDMLIDPIKLIICDLFMLLGAHPFMLKGATSGPATAGEHNGV